MRLRQADLGRQTSHHALRVLLRIRPDAAARRAQGSIALQNKDTPLGQENHCSRQMEYPKPN
eukprot:6121742-Prorocentrum_lima.AAC.1